MAAPPSPGSPEPGAAPPRGRSTVVANTRYAAVFGVIAILVAIFVALPLWFGASFLFVASAYFFNRPLLLGKRPDGRLSPVAVTVLFPYFATTWMLWWLRAVFSGEPAFDEVAPGLWVGRRLRRGEAPPPDLALVVDLTSEFAEPSHLRDAAEYLCTPALDAAIPDDDAFRSAVERVLWARGNVFVHCAFGHGRSAAIAAAVVIARGQATDVTSAELMMKARRPKIGLNTTQRGAIERALLARRAVRAP